MSSAKLRLKRLESLLILSARIAGESSGGVLGDSLDLLIEGSAAFGGAAFAHGEAVEQVAERGLSGAGNQAELRRALRSVARRALQNHRPLWLRDVRGSQHALKEVGELVAAGCASALALPIEHRRMTLGALVLLFDDPALLDEETAGFGETVAHVLALALDRDRRIEEDAAQRAEIEAAGHQASVGLLTASVAHELRGPVGALVLQLEEQERMLHQLELLGGPSDTALGGTVAELSELTRDIEAAVSRLRTTTEQLGEANRHDSSPENLDLSTVVRESLAVARPHLERRGIALVEQLDPGCFTAGRRDNLGQVVLNLVFNAADACARSPSSKPRISVRATEEKDRVVLVVDDNGPGIADPKTIFTPFFTTKGSGQGTGMGLKICSDVVTAHGGHIEVVNRPEGGASFRVVLPRSDDESGVHPVAPVVTIPTPKPGGMPSQRSVLVVDDDPVFSRSLRRALRGHVIRTCSTASEAEIALLDTSYTPDVILCDVFLPGANGDALHARVASSRPDLAPRFVFMTGGALGKAEADYIKRSGCRTLFKPLDLKDLQESIEPDPDSVPPNSVRTLSAPPSRTPAVPSWPPRK